MSAAAPVQSMTGFGRAEGHARAGAVSGRWVWELRSVNSKGLDVRLRLPSGLEAIEAECRRILASRFSRGSIQAGLQFDRDIGEGVPVVNEAALDAVVAAALDLARRIGSPPPAAEALLSVRGVLEPGEPAVSNEEIAARNADLTDGLSRACEGLEEARRAEGRAVAAVLSGHVDRIEALVAAIEADPSRSPEAIRGKLRDQLAILLDEASQLDPQRLHQEAALLATRADIREEIDRLKAHVASARRLLATGGPAGRKFDFLAQEFNRECNTICSKSNAASVTEAGLEMKVVIDQLREQVQNIE